jgi:hypothetical protein
MTVDLCTKSCKEIGQPLAALNYGTVSQPRAHVPSLTM